MGAHGRGGEGTKLSHTPHPTLLFSSLLAPHPATLHHDMRCNLTVEADEVLHHTTHDRPGMRYLCRACTVRPGRIRRQRRWRRQQQRRRGRRKAAEAGTGGGGKGGVKGAGTAEAATTQKQWKRGRGRRWACTSATDVEAEDKTENEITRRFGKFQKMDVALGRGRGRSVFEHASRSGSK